MTNGNSRSLLIKEAGMDPSTTPPYYIVDDDFQSTSPTDSSEDSIDVVRIPRSPILITPSTSTTKRKYTPHEEHTIKDSGPLKKRLCARTIEQQTPFRPWNDTPIKSSSSLRVQRVVSTTCPKIVPGYENDAPLSLVTKPPSLALDYNSSRSSSPLNLTVQASSPIPIISPVPLHRLAPYLPPSPFSPVMPIPLIVTPKAAYFRPPSPIQVQPVALIKKTIPEPLRVPIHPAPSIKTEESEVILTQSEKLFPNLFEPKVERESEAKFRPPVLSNSDIVTSGSSSKKEQQRNYKNMTRERRIEANARERTRVHTISAAFEALRSAVPAYSDTQKLSKLAVLRIACGYITTLSNLLEDSPNLAESVEAMTRMLEKEGNVKRKKDVDIDEDW